MALDSVGATNSAPVTSDYIPMPIINVLYYFETYISTTPHINSLMINCVMQHPIKYQ